MKKSLVAKTCTPGGPSICQLAKETGIPSSTIRGWVKVFSADEEISKGKRPKDWTPSERLEAVMESHGLEDEKLGEFLRKKGLHSNQIEEWKREISLMANESIKKRGRPRLDPEVVALREENKRLKRDILRKDRALAEASAILILKKKAEDLWGKDEDDE